MKKKKRIPVDGQSQLTHSPFADLGPLIPRDNHEEIDPVQSPEFSDPTKANRLLIREEKRAKGKWVTCVYHLESEEKDHLKKLKRKLGTGGCIGEKGQLELQGHHVSQITSYFKSLGYRLFGSS